MLKPFNLLPGQFYVIIQANSLWCRCLWWVCWGPGHIIIVIIIIVVNSLSWSQMSPSVTVCTHRHTTWTVVNWQLLTVATATHSSASAARTDAAPAAASWRLLAHNSSLDVDHNGIRYYRDIQYLLTSLQNVGGWWQMHPLNAVIVS